MTPRTSRERVLEKYPDAYIMSSGHAGKRAVYLEPKDAATDRGQFLSDWMYRGTVEQREQDTWNDAASKLPAVPEATDAQETELKCGQRIGTNVCSYPESDPIHHGEPRRFKDELGRRVTWVSHLFIPASPAPPVDAARPELPKLVFTEADRKQMGFNAVDAVVLHMREDQLLATLRENEGLREQLDLTQQLEKSTLPCGHLSRYGFTDNGGKTGYCTLCELSKLRAELDAIRERTEKAIEWLEHPASLKTVEVHNALRALKGK